MTTINSAAQTRLLTLDAIRGVAVMGILLMNVIAFTMPEQAYINPLAWGGTRAVDLGAWAVNFVLIDGKMRGLFSLLFGASMLLVVERAEAKGEDGGRVHARRMVWLLLFGLAHYYLIWFGDILVLYAVIGCIAWLFSDREPVNLIKWGIIFLVVSFFLWAFMQAMMVMMQMAASAPGASAEAIKGLEELRHSLGAPGSPGIAKEIAVYRGDYTDILGYRFGDRATGPLLMILMSGIETLGLMLLGMALLRNGFLTGTWAPERYRGTAIRYYLIGLPPMILLCLWCLYSGFDPLTVFGAVFVWASPFRIVLVIAHAALALWLLQRFAHSAIVVRLAATGRAAFTNYLGTSIVMTTIFYGYGFGLFGAVSRAGVYLFVLGVWALMLLWSKPWLDRFAYGPFEWLWRSLARGGVQPMRRTRIG
ncbi:DUF418 domain-containing protein [Sphingomonas sp. LaA6.9]|uniref:DUF418 domain-containing protein n=1 Tax=Sphingomonas sp. LaA6.9 TaxID=2919914 RepID=UPI001F4FA006|nr:DUF418 domain-containing protein [Sphingomonas sp. LaA6.9]MCJ8159582.1 DUF418 domain-containing protein [Sphingomonas sp. LaA6.9]